MNIRKMFLGMGSVIAMTVAGCAAADKTASTPAAQPLTGWYLHGASGSRFQPCGKSEQWQVAAKADLETRAKAFGLQDDTPVYVKLLANMSGQGGGKPTIDVVRVVQFGSPTPVRDCGMTGVVMPAP